LLKVVVEACEELNVHKHNAKSEVRHIKTWNHNRYNF
jgi:hypothetical protein